MNRWFPLQIILHLVISCLPGAVIQIYQWFLSFPSRDPWNPSVSPREIANSFLGGYLEPSHPSSPLPFWGHYSSPPNSQLPASSVQGEYSLSTPGAFTPGCLPPSCCTICIECFSPSNCLGKFSSFKVYFFPFFCPLTLPSSVSESINGTCCFVVWWWVESVSPSCWLLVRSYPVWYL